MLTSPRTRARSRLSSTKTLIKAGSRLRIQARSSTTRVIKPHFKTRRLLNAWRLILKISSHINLSFWPTANLNWSALAIGLSGLGLTYIVISRLTPDFIYNLPPVGSYAPVIILVGWALAWLSKGLGISPRMNYAVTTLVCWCLWLRLQNLVINLWLVLTIIGLGLGLFGWFWLGEKYLFSRKSIRKGILR